MPVLPLRADNIGDAFFSSGDVGGIDEKLPASREQTSQCLAHLRQHLEFTKSVQLP